MNLRRLDKPTHGGYANRPVKAHEAIGDGVVRDGLALRIDRADAPAAERTKTERARLFLQALRMGNDGSGLTFGQRILGGIDAVESLRSYYPSIDLANALLEAFPGGAHGVANYLGELSVPKDLRRLLETMIVAKAAGPVGNVATWEQDAKYNNMWAQWQTHNMDVTRVNDPTIEKFFGAWAFPSNNLQTRLNGDVEFNVNAMNMFARAAELGAALQTPAASFVPQLPATEAGALALKRYCAATNVAENTVAFHGRTLDQWAGAIAKAPPARAKIVKHPGRPLGDDKTWRDEANGAAWTQVLNAGNANALKIDDVTLEKVFTQWGMNPAIQQYRNYGDANFKLGLVKLFARAKEKGLPVQAEPNQVNAYFSKHIAITPESIRIYHRLARAFGVAPNQLILANQNLQQIPIPAGGDNDDGSLIPEPAVCGRKGGDLAAVQKLVADGDDAILRLDDGAIAHLAQAVPIVAVLGQKSAEADWHLGLIGLVTRAIHLGVYNLNHLTPYVSSIPNAVLQDPRIGSALALAVHQTNLDPNTALSNGRTLSTCEDTSTHLADLDRVLKGADAPLPRRRGFADLEQVPLGDNPGPYNNLYNAKDVRFFEQIDAAIEPFKNNEPAQILAHFNNNPLTFKFFARYCEVYPQSQTFNKTKTFMQQPIAAAYVSGDAPLHLLRLAQAVDMDPTTVRITTNDNAVIPLTDHPALAALDSTPEEATARRIALAEDIAELAPGQHDAVREGALMRLLFENGDYLHDLAELLPALIASRADGALDPIDLMNTPKDHATKFLGEVLEGAPHVGAAAVIMALATKAPIAIVREALAGMGYFPRQVERYANLTSTLGGLSNDDMSFVLADLARNPGEADFGAIELRVELTKKEVSSKRLDALLEDTDATTVLSAVFDRAAQVPDGHKTRTELLAYVDDLVKKEAVTSAEVHAALDLDTAMKLDPQRIVQLDKLIAGCVSAEDAARQVALEKLVGDLEQGSKYLDSTALTTRAMLTFYREDLKQVAPLGEADVQLGGVKGKPWDVRGKDDSERVTIEGVSLPIDTRADRAAHAIPRADPSPQFGSKAGRHMLRLLAARWRVAGPISLAGPGAGDMKPAVKFMAAQTQSPYREIHLDDFDDPAKLFEADGQLIKAAKAGEVVHLITNRPLDANMLALLQGSFDSKGNIKPPPPGVAVSSDAAFRLVFSDAKRGGNVAPSQLPAFSTLTVRASDAAELSKLVLKESPKLSEQLAAQLAATHVGVEAQLVAGNFGDPPPSIGVERLFNVARRLANTPPNGDDVIDPNIVRRNVEEVYGGAINPAFIQNLTNALNLTVPGQVQMPAEADLAVVDGGASINGIMIPRDPDGGKLTKADVALLGLTPQMAHVLRALAEALEQRDSVCLIGPPLPAVQSLEEAYGVLSGRPFARYIATPTTPVTDFIDIATGEFKPEFAGAAIVIEAFDEASQEFRETITRAADRSRENGEGVRLIARQFAEVQKQNPVVPDSMTVLRLDAVKDAGGEKAIVESAAERMGLPESMASSLYDLHTKVVQSYAGNVIGRNLNPKPVYGLNELFGAMKLALELIPDLGMASAYMTAVETFYCAQLPADMDQIVAFAKEIAK